MAFDSSRTGASRPITEPNRGNLFMASSAIASALTMIPESVHAAGLKIFTDDIRSSEVGRMILEEADMSATSSSGLQSIWQALDYSPGWNPFGIVLAPGDDWVVFWIFGPLLALPVFNAAYLVGSQATGQLKRMRPFAKQREDVIEDVIEEKRFPGRRLLKRVFRKRRIPGLGLVKHIFRRGRSPDDAEIKPSLDALSGESGRLLQEMQSSQYTRPPLAPGYTRPGETEDRRSEKRKREDEQKQSEQSKRAEEGKEDKEDCPRAKEGEEDKEDCQRAKENENADLTSAGAVKPGDHVRIPNDKKNQRRFLGSRRLYKRFIERRR